MPLQNQVILIPKPQERDFNIPHQINNMLNLSKNTEKYFDPNFQENNCFSPLFYRSTEYLNSHIGAYSFYEKETNFEDGSSAVYFPNNIIFAKEYANESKGNALDLQSRNDFSVTMNSDIHDTTLFNKHYKHFAGDHLVSKHDDISSYEINNFTEQFTIQSTLAENTADFSMKEIIYPFTNAYVENYIKDKKSCIITSELNQLDCNAAENYKNTISGDFNNLSHNNKIPVESLIQSKTINTDSFIENPFGISYLKKNYSCSLCPTVFKLKGSFMVHTSVAHSSEYEFGHSENLPTDNKKITENRSDKWYKCPKCNKCFKKEQYIMQHMKIHEEKQWKCDVCSKLFTTKYFLKIHKRLHSGEMPYKCDICNKSFTFQQSYRKHQLYHNDDKPHSCTTCGRAFKELSTLHNHERIHTGEKPFVCEICGKCFRQRISYLVHNRIHTGVLPYRCTTCGKYFRYKISHRTHECQISTDISTQGISNLVQPALQPSLDEEFQNLLPFIM